MWIYIANKCTKFYAKRLSPSENIVENRRGLLFLTQPVYTFTLKAGLPDWARWRQLATFDSHWRHKFGFDALRLFESLAGAHFEQLKAGFCWILL